MILTCPNCATQYVVKDGAIPPQGRQVRCANCKHSWHQDPETVAEAESPAEEPETLTEATVIEPRSGPEAEERAYEEAMLEAEDFHWLGESLRKLGVPVFNLLEVGYSNDLPDLILAYLKGLEGK